jgi:hypothetical protein
MGKVWKSRENNSVKKLWKILAWKKAWQIFVEKYYICNCENNNNNNCFHRFNQQPRQARQPVSPQNTSSVDHKTRPAQPLTTLFGTVYYDYSYRPWTTKVHYTTTKTTKVYIHYNNVLNRVAATSAAASSSILYPKKTLPTTSSDGKSRQARRQTLVVCCSAAGRTPLRPPRRTHIIYTQLKRKQSSYTKHKPKNITNNKKQKELCKGG